MALIATHIRFALDLKDKYQVSDLGKYVSGTIYPDSRYVTGVERKITHPQGYELELVKKDDFRKGWGVHLLCDKVQKEITKEKFPEIFIQAGADQGQGSDLWIRLTTLKIIQDIDDVSKYDIVKYLPLLDYIEAANGEDRAKLLEYNKIFQGMYVNPSTDSIQSQYGMWKAFGIGEEMARKVKIQAEKYKADNGVTSLVHEIYSEMLRRSL